MIDIKKAANGWESQKEYSYWIPECDIEGKIPLDLHGSFIRNGPGVNEVYGKKLKHRKFFNHLGRLPTKNPKASTIDELRHDVMF